MLPKSLVDSDSFGGAHLLLSSILTRRPVLAPIPTPVRVFWWLSVGIEVGRTRFRGSGNGRSISRMTCEQVRHDVTQDFKSTTGKDWGLREEVVNELLELKLKELQI